jgi:hypothetical protein
MSVRISGLTIAALVCLLCVAGLAACGRAGPPVRSRPAPPPAAAAPAGVPEPAQAEPDPEEKQP